MYMKGHAQGYTSLIPEKFHHSTWVTNRAIDWLDRRRDPEKPFFLSVGYFDPHHAFNPCEPYASLFAEADISEPVFREGAIETKPAHYQRKFEGDRKITRQPEKMQGILRAYHAMMAHVDACFGRMAAALERLGIADNTLILYTSDHGELLGNHGLLWKGPYLLDDLLRVPLIIGRAAGPLAPGLAGASTEELTSAIDIMPTIQALAGFERETGRPIVGADLSLFPQGSHEFVIAEWEAPKPSPTSSLRCIRTRQAKLVYYGNDPTQGEYYNLAEDPNEFDNHSGMPFCAATRRGVFERMAGYYLTRRPGVRHGGAW
jgi:arylsulfatase A-like enzyme